MGKNIYKNQAIQFPKDKRSVFKCLIKDNEEQIYLQIKSKKNNSIGRNKRIGWTFFLKFNKRIDPNKACREGKYLKKE